MPVSSSSTIVVLLIILVGLLVLIAGLLIAILRRLPRSQAAQTGDLAVPPDGGGEPLAGEVPSGSAFECFLDEDPNRRLLPKKEQAAAYRIWRKEKGLNWSASAGS